MRTLLVSAALLLSTSSFAQDLKFPVNCEAGYRTSSVEALCVHHRHTTMEAEEKYLTAFVRLNSVEDWKKLQDIRLRFMTRFNVCAAQGNAGAVAECLTPAFETFINELPRYQAGQLYGYPSTQVDSAIAKLILASGAAFDACTTARIKVLDDGISPARDIAASIGTQDCQDQALNQAAILVEVGYSFLSKVPDGGRVYEMTVAINSIDLRVKRVLEYRAQQRSKSQQPKKGTASRKVES